LALAEICDGGTRSAAARIGGVSLQSIRDWVLRFNAGGPEALIDANNAGRKPKLGASELQALVRVVEEGPLPAIHGVVRWRLVDLRQWVWEEFGIETSVQSLSEQLRALGYRKLSARPRHPAHDALGELARELRCNQQHQGGQGDERPCQHATPTRDARHRRAPIEHARERRGFRACLRPS
jgi:transposase